MSNQPTPPSLGQAIADKLQADMAKGGLDHTTNPLGQPDATKQKLLDAANAARKAK